MLIYLALILFGGGKNRKDSMIEITILAIRCNIIIFWQFCHIVIVGAPFGTASRFISRIYIFFNQQIFSVFADTRLKKRNNGELIQ